jgi:steroid 5-alpha reductase family enzyme
VQRDFDGYDFLVKICFHLSNVDYVPQLLIDHDHEHYQLHHVVVAVAVVVVVVAEHVIDVVDDVVAMLLVVVPIVHEQLQDFQQIAYDVFS